jgi:hypothetical protein
MAWGAAFNGQTSLPLMAELLQRKKSEQSPPKTTPFSHPKGFFQFGPRNFVLLQSGPWLKCNWIFAFPRHFQAGPWILIFSIWTPIKPQTLIFLQLSP